METLRHIRERAGLSQPELSGLTGVAQGTISDIELGKRKPRGRTLRKLAQALGVQVTDLLGESETLKAQPPLFRELPEEAHSESEDRRSLEDALRDPSSSEEAFRKAVLIAPTPALQALAEELVSNYHTPRTQEDPQSEPRQDVFKRVKAFARATIIGEELECRGAEPPERHNLALKRFADAMASPAPQYQEQEGREAG